MNTYLAVAIAASMILSLIYFARRFYRAVMQVESVTQEVEDMHDGEEK